MSLTTSSHPGSAWVSLPITMALLVALFAGSANEAAASPASEARADTVPVTSRRMFERRVLFSPEYLGRIFEAVKKREAAELAARARAEEDERLVVAYADRYRISLDLSRQIFQTALAEGVDPELGFRLIRVESVFRPNARGPGGSLGLTQLMPATARALDRGLRTEAEILDPAANLRIGFRYLRQMIELYDGDVRLGLLAYNRGETAVNRSLRAGRDPENGYSLKVLGTASNRYGGAGVVPR